ncbi:MAG: hypothetical protein WC729_08125 [Sphingomonas sp.]|jgi:hypothetical protein|uniref:hypothetical protein n=1 Tax=Sphingomonas sp. TaxID=28214 RepID=UPI003561A1EF
MDGSVIDFLSAVSGSRSLQIYVKCFVSAVDDEVYPISLFIKTERAEGEIRISGIGHGLISAPVKVQVVHMNGYGEVSFINEWNGINFADLSNKNVEECGFSGDGGVISAIYIKIEEIYISILAIDDEMRIDAGGENKNVRESEWTVI